MSMWLGGEGVVYKGCYEDDGDRDLPDLNNLGHDNSRETCGALCRSKGKSAIAMYTKCYYMCVLKNTYNDDSIGGMVSCHVVFCNVVLCCVV